MVIDVPYRVRVDMVLSWLSYWGVKDIVDDWDGRYGEGVVRGVLSGDSYRVLLGRLGKDEGLCRLGCLGVGEGDVYARRREEGVSELFGLLFGGVSLSSASKILKITGVTGASWVKKEGYRVRRVGVSGGELVWVGRGVG